MTKRLSHGTSRKLLLLILGAAASTAIASSCTKGEGKDSDEEGVKANAFVVVAPVTKGAVEETIAAYGKVEPAADATEPVVADLECTVIKVWVRSGQVVKAGEAIAQVRDSKGARLDAARAKIDVDFADKDLARVTSLRDKGLATNADVAQAQAAVDKSRAELATLGGAGGTRTVRAPFLGLVQSVVAKPGDAVAAGGPLIVLTSTGAAPGAAARGERVRFGIEPAAVARIAGGAVVHVRALYSQDAAVEGTVVQVNPQVDPVSHQAGVFVALTGAPFVQGAMCRGDIVVRRELNAIVVPRESVMGDAVFIVVGGQGKDAYAKRVGVEILIDDGKNVAVRPKGDALREGASVVSVGAAELEDGMAVRTSDEHAAAGGKADKDDEPAAKEGAK